MIKLNQKGFTAFEVAIVIVALAAIGAAGYFAYQARQDKTDYSVSVPKSKNAAPPKSDETSSWLLYESPGKEFKIRLADGWKLVRTDGQPSLYAHEELMYIKGTRAHVSDTSFGRGGPFPLGIVFAKEPFQGKRGTSQGKIKTNSGLVGEKYIFVQDAEEVGHDLPKGDKEYTYYFSKNGKYIYINHSVFGDFKDSHEIVEKAVKTLEL